MRTSPTNFRETLEDLFAAVKAIQQSSGNNAPLIKLEPADPNAFWYPTRTYSYTLAPVSDLDPVVGAALREALRNQVIANAGAGKL